MNKKKIYLDCQVYSKLADEVKRELNNVADYFEDGVEGAINVLLNGGVDSNTLIYMMTDDDLLGFYKRHEEAICCLLDYKYVFLKDKFLSEIDKLDVDDKKRELAKFGLYMMTISLADTSGINKTGVIK